MILLSGSIRFSSNGLGEYFIYFIYSSVKIISFTDEWARGGSVHSLARWQTDKRLSVTQAEKQPDAFDFSPQIFLFMTSKLDYHDRNGHIARNIFHCYTMISSLAKVMGL